MNKDTHAESSENRNGLFDPVAARRCTEKADAVAMMCQSPDATKGVIK